MDTEPSLRELQAAIAADVRRNNQVPHGAIAALAFAFLRKLLKHCFPEIERHWRDAMDERWWKHVRDSIDPAAEMMTARNEEIARNRRMNGYRDAPLMGKRIRLGVIPPR